MAVKKNKLNQMLMSEDKGVTRTPGANGTLSRMFRQILKDLDIGPSKFGNLMADFIHDSRYGIPDNKKDQSSTRGNLVREFAKTQMSWKVFCKAMRFLQLVRFDLVLTAHHANGSRSHHSASVVIGRRKELQSFEEGLEQPAKAESSGEYVECLGDVFQEVKDEHTSNTNDFIPDGQPEKE